MQVRRIRWIIGAMPSMPTATTARPSFDREQFLNDREIPKSVHGMNSAEDFVKAARTEFGELNTRLREALSDWASPIIVYRGHVDAGWGLHSTLFRALSDARPGRISERDLADAEQRVLESARKPIEIETPKHGKKLGLNLSDGQLLAVLQHHATPTRFVDVTQDALVGLYFASEKSDGIDGRLFFIVLPSGDPQDPGADYTEGKSWLSLGSAPAQLPWSAAVRGRATADSAWTSRVFLVDGGGLDPRMSAQKGAFIVGGCNRSYSNRNTPYKGDYLTAAELLEVSSVAINFRQSLQKRKAGQWSAYAWTIRIPSELKSQIRTLLTEDGVGEDSIYPDFDAFKQLGIDRAKAVG